MKRLFLLPFFVLLGTCQFGPPTAPWFTALPDSATIGTDVSVTTESVDPDREPVSIRVAWGNNETSDWSDPQPGRARVTFSRRYDYPGTYELTAQARDETGSFSRWSGVAPLDVFDTLPAPATVRNTIDLSACPLDLDCSPDGARLYVAGDTGGLFVIDTRTDRILQRVARDWDVRCLAVRRDGERLYVGTRDSMLYVLHAADLTVLDSTLLPGIPFRIAALTESDPLIIVAYEHPLLAISRLREPDLSQRQDLALNNSVKDIAVGPDNCVYASRSDWYEIAVVDPVRFEVETTIPLDYEPDRLAVAPDRDWLLITHTDDGRITKVRTADHAVVDTIPAGAGPRGITFLPDGRRFYVTHQFWNGGRVRLWNVIAHHARQSIFVGAHPHDILALPDGSKLYVANRVSLSLSVIGH